MTKKKKGLLPRIEILIILVFFISFILWAMSKCSAKQSLNERLTPDEDLTAQEDSVPDFTITPKPLPQNADAIDASQNETTAKAPVEELSKLFITIEGLKLRTGPDLDSTVIYQFPLFEEVYFMNEVTDSTYQISLGKEIADEPWVKVKNKRGKIGWVYGAGVNYYKKKREGVQ